MQLIGLTNSKSLMKEWDTIKRQKRKKYKENLVFQQENQAVVN